MKIAILGATGRVGSRIADEALRRGHTVTAVARHADALAERAGLVRVTGDAADADALAPKLQGHDVLISTMRFGPGFPDADTVLKLARAAAIGRLLVVGGAGSLFVAPDRQLVDLPDFPREYLVEARAGRDFLNRLRQESAIDWVFLSPSAEFNPGERTGHYRVGKDELLVDANGKSWISMDDYAIAMVDELESRGHSRERFTVGY